MDLKILKIASHESKILAGLRLTNTYLFIGVGTTMIKPKMFSSSNLKSQCLGFYLVIFSRPLKKFHENVVKF